MQLHFYKYQGTGNDFILIDNRKDFFKNDTKLISRLCDRKFGIGADGLILLQKPEEEADDFKMVYFNADGKQSSMCGNGGRCIVHFAKFLGIIEKEATFTAIDGKHLATVNPEDVKLQMQDIDEVSTLKNAYFVDSGSPHHIVFTENVQEIDVKANGSEIRYNNLYKKTGVNVNFVEQTGENKFYARTYERGVEDETLSCGTGVTAVAIAAFEAGLASKSTISIDTLGGNLQVSFEKEDKHYKNIWLSGPAEQVFKGEILC
ncbi:diaminopimelate epimerase [Haloflavibacter putidus]|uniref:Diaminopimelate epimerase n=1 Tax=Haloflavibacter putidus TaxID=2576776 RepID=A0A507ZQ78_9FLAO|nr:diaminopimelate epimerase [Haloflavibacter putidus]TQD39157.1 diaminopimelate epimerase [Haloflavibacter putidus]